MNTNHFSSSELAQFRALNTPERIQRFLDEIAYNHEPTCRSPRRVLSERGAQCLEGAMFGAAALRIHGFPPLVLDLEAVRDDDHVIAVYRRNGCWGAVAKSNYSGIRFREPVYRTARELAISYFEDYLNTEGEKTLRGYSRFVNLARFDNIDWMTAEDDLWDISEYLFTIRHHPLIPAEVARKRTYADARLFAAGMVGHASESSKPRALRKAAHG